MVSITVSPELKMVLSIAGAEMMKAKSAVETPMESGERRRPLLMRKLLQRRKQKKQGKLKKLNKHRKQRHQ